MTKILVIEDEAQVLDNIQEILEIEDFDTITAENGCIGVQLAKVEAPDLIICDVMMPEMDGYGVLTALRQYSATVNIPLIFLTAKADRSDVRQGMELGADDYLTKPFTPAELLKAIATRLEKKAAVQELYMNQIRQVEAKLNHLVYHNSLTGLPNQLLLRERFNQVQAQLNYNEPTSILLVSLDQFNWINSSLGHTFSDLLIKAAAKRLTTYITNIDSNIDTLVHLNADQFIILLKTIQHREDAAGVAQTILDVLSQPFVLNGQEVVITASIGIALCPGDSSNIDDLTTNAEVAMGGAKQQGGNQYQFYTTEMKSRSSNRLALEASLRHALEREEFQVYYQPQVDLQTGQIISAEALVRWNHPQWGLVSPAHFIPLAEENGLIIPIGEWVLRTACVQAKAWQIKHLAPLKVAVNLSARQVVKQNLSKRIVEILIESGLNPQFLELEITESILMQDTQTAIKTLTELKAIGVQISIDDFGIGYSSLNYLQKFPFDTLKVDRCFVSNIASNPENAVITKAIIQMAHDLNLKVIAEGVETEAELTFLCQQQCNAMQGYLFSRPIPAAEFEILLTAGKQLRMPKLDFQTALLLRQTPDNFTTQPLVSFFK